MIVPRFYFMGDEFPSGLTATVHSDPAPSGHPDAVPLRNGWHGADDSRQPVYAERKAA